MSEQTLNVTGWRAGIEPMQLSPHALPAEQVLQQLSTGIVDQGIGAEGRRMIDAGSGGKA